MWDPPTQITEDHWITELENRNKYSKPVLENKFCVLSRYFS